MYEDVCRPFLFHIEAFAFAGNVQREQNTGLIVLGLSSDLITSGLHRVYLIRFVCSSSSEILKADIQILEMVFPLKTICWWDRC